MNESSSSKDSSKQTNKNSSMTSNDELLYYMLGQVNQEKNWGPAGTCHKRYALQTAVTGSAGLKYYAISPKAKTACSTTISVSSGSVECAVRGCNRPKI